MNTGIRVLVADDHKLVLASLRTLLDSSEGFHVVAEATDGRQAVALAKQHLPHVAILDAFMPELNGIAAAERFKLELPQIRVLILSSVVSKTLLLETFRAGATGYVLRSAGPNDFLSAVRSVAQGEYYVGPEASRCLIQECLTVFDQQTDDCSRLTLRQREVLQLITEGHTTKIIAKNWGSASRPPRCTARS